MIEILDDNLKIDNSFNIYGVANVSENEYNVQLKEFTTSNYCQIKKILEDNNSAVYIAISVSPNINPQKDSKIKEIVELLDYKPLFNDFENHKTTGYCKVYCKSVLVFNEYSKNKTFFEIRPNGQYLIKKLFDFQNDNMIKYIKESMQTK